MDDYDVLLMTGVAQVLNDLEIATWRSTTTYESGERAIALDGLPQQRSAISLSAYTLEDDPVEDSNLTGLQVICREPGDDSTAARGVAVRVFRALHGRVAWQLPSGLHVVDLYRRSHVAGGQDQNGDHSVIQNFHAHLHTPPPEETP